MNNVIAVIFGFLGVTAVFYWVINNAPEVKHYTDYEMHYVKEKKTRPATATVKVNDKEVVVEYDSEYEVVKPVGNTKSREVQPTQLQELQFWCVLGVGVIFGIYMMVVLGLWAVDKIKGKRYTKNSQDTQKRIDGIVSFSTGILVGFLTSADFSNKPDFSKPITPEKSSFAVPDGNNTVIRDAPKPK